MNFGLERGTVSGQIYHKKFVEDNATKEFVKLPLRGIKDKRKHDDKGKNGVLPQIYSPFLRQAVHNLFTDQGQNEENTNAVKLQLISTVCLKGELTYTIKRSKLSKMLNDQSPQHTQESQPRQVRKVSSHNLGQLHNSQPLISKRNRSGNKKSITEVRINQFHSPSVKKKCRQSTKTLRLKWLHRFNQDQLAQVKLVEEINKGDVTKGIHIKNYGRLFPDVIRLEMD